MYFTYDKTELQNRNYNEKLVNLEKTLNLWKMRDLSLIGRILIVKTLGISKFVFASSIIGMEDDVVQKVERLLYSFIWQGNGSKVKKSVLVSNYDSGGVESTRFKTYY